MDLTRRSLFAWLSGGAALVVGVPRSLIRENPYLRGTRYAAALDALPEHDEIFIYSRGMTWVDAEYDEGLDEVTFSSV